MNIRKEKKKYNRLMLKFSNLNCWFMVNINV